MRLILLILLSVCYGTIIHVPADYSTIQEGIDASIEGDTVLVDQGIYYENLILDKSITLTSNAIYDDLTEWYEYSTTFSQYELTNDNIANTVISGSESTNGEIFQSVILINGADCLEPLIFGFTIKGGSGTQTEEVIDSTSVILLRGGGILSNNALPEMHYNFILDNQNNEDDLYAGGGMNTGTGVDFPENQLGILNSNTRCDGDIDLSHNFYRENESLYGNTLATTDFVGNIDMSESIFDVYDCPDEEVTEVWVDTDEEVEITFEDGVGDLCSIVEDVWVSPDGDDYLNTGVSQSNAFLTITHALQMIAPDDDNDITINLTEGTFSPSTTGETFSIIMISNVNLIGQGEEVTILNAEQTDRVITMENCEGNTISGLTIAGGVENSGGGILIYGSIVDLYEITIEGNRAAKGGGIGIINGGHANLTNVLIRANSAVTAEGNAIFSEGSMELTKVIITENDTGFALANLQNSILNDVKITNHVGTAIYNIRNGILNNVLISDNNVGIRTNYNTNAEQGILNNVTISNNAVTGIHFVVPNVNLSIMNSIIWGNGESFAGVNSDVVINYSNVEGDSVLSGLGNLNVDPLFSDPYNGDYSLSDNSPCIDVGDPGPFYNDIDLSRNDLGAYGGSRVMPNFLEYNFGHVGQNGETVNWNLFNYRETEIIIDGVSFSTNAFHSNTTFPLIIEPLEVGMINIQCFSNELGEVHDQMLLDSEDIADGAFVDITAELIAGNTLIGALNGIIEESDYIITGDISIETGDTLIIQSGTKFLFEGEFYFTVYGVMKAEGTVNDSIIFDNLLEDTTSKWIGLKLYNQSNETILKYVRISGAQGGGLYLENSNPFLENIKINNNMSNYGGGLFLSFSDPIMSNCYISNNYAFIKGGGVYMSYSNPFLSNISIVNNTVEGMGGGLYIKSSYPTFSEINIMNNSAIDDGGYFFGGGGLAIYQCPNLTINDIHISNNNTGRYGAGILIWDYNQFSAGSIIISNSIITQNEAEMGGGGIFLTYISELLINNSIISHNLSNISGGGIESWDSNLKVTNSMIVDNYATYLGGGINSRSYTSSITIYLQNVTLSGNDETNYANYESGAIHCNQRSNKINLINCILWNESENEIYLEESLYYPLDTIIINYSNIKGGENNIINNNGNLIWGIENFDDEPLFLSSENGDYSLLIDSPCIDAGTPFLIWEGDTLVNMGTEDYIGEAPDMGGIEHICESGIYDECGVCDGDNSICGGCMDSEALNYSPDALAQYGECIYYNPLALNFFISEYIEGSNSSIRAIELYNSTDSLINLLGFELWLIIGGGDWTEGAEQNFPLPEFNLVPSEVFVLCKSDFSAECDYIENLPFTGDDAVGLAYVGTLIDQIGDEGEDPGAGWTINGIEEATKNHTLIRHPSVLIGDTNWENSSNNDWIVYDVDTFNYLGFHDIDELNLLLSIPNEFKFKTPFPNPFNPTTQIKYGLPENAQVQIVVYNIAGRQVQSLINEFQTAGYHYISWEASAYPSGVYLIRMESGSFTQTQKVVLVK